MIKYLFTGIKTKIMKKLTQFLILSLIVITSISCTSNARAKAWGGTSKIELAKGQALVNVTWKNSDLWILTEVRPDSVEPKTYRFTEESSYGMMEGNIILKEK